MTNEIFTIPETPNNALPVIKFKFRLICASKCKKFALEFSKSNPAPTKAGKFTRVSEDFLVSCEIALKNHIMSRVKNHPFKGKTLM